MKINPSDITEVATPFMQETHLEEIAMLNELYDLFDQVRQGLETPALAQKIDAVVVHTHAHFERENEHMFVLNFPPYAVHKQVHDEHLQALDHVVGTWKKDENIEPLFVFFEDTTPAWMKQHISTMDFVTANFFAMVEQNSGV